MGSGLNPALFNHCSAAGKRVHPETEAVMSNSRHFGRRAIMSLRLAKKAIDAHEWVLLIDAAAVPP